MQEAALFPELPILLGGAKKLGIVYLSLIRGAKEPRNLQNHRGGKLCESNAWCYFAIALVL